MNRFSHMKNQQNQIYGNHTFNTPKRQLTSLYAIMFSMEFGLDIDHRVYFPRQGSEKNKKSFKYWMENQQFG